MAQSHLVFNDQFPYEYANYLSKLSERERKVVVSYFGIGTAKISIEEISELLRDPAPDTNEVRNLLSLAMGKLRDAYDRNKPRKPGASSV